MRHAIKKFLTLSLILTGCFTVANAMANDDSITLTVTNPLPAHALINLPYTATYTLTSQTTPMRDIKVVLPTLTSNPWSYTNSCDQVPGKNCVLNITLTDPSIDKITQFQPQISVQGTVIKDTNPPYDITVDDQVDAQIDIVKPFTPQTVYPNKGVSHGIYNVTNLQKPSNMTFDKVEIDPQSLPDGMTIDPVATTCQQSLTYLEGCEMGFTYAPTKSARIHFKPNFLAYKGSNVWHITSPDSVAQDLLALYWLKADQSKGKLIEMVEDPQTHTLYGDTEMFDDTHGHFVQNLLVSTDFGVTWLYDTNADLGKLTCYPNCAYAEKLQIMKWQTNQPEPLGFLLNGPGGAMFSLYITSPAPQFLVTPLNVYKSFSYSANNDDYQILIRPSTVPFISMAIHSRVSNAMATVADFTQPPFSSYPLTQVFKDPGANRVDVVTSSVTHKIYLQLVDDNNYAHVFSADMSNPLQITQSSWQNIATVQLHFNMGISDTNPAYFGIESDATQGVDRLYSAGIRVPNTIQPDAHTSVYNFIPGQSPQYIQSFETATAIRLVPTGGVYVALANSLIFSPDDGKTITKIDIPNTVVFPIRKLYLLDNHRLSFLDSEKTSQYSNFGSMYVDASPNE